MQRYHKNIYFPDIDKLRELNNTLNSCNWKYSAHALNNMKHRISDIENLLQFINNMTLKEADIFEYYKLYDNIEKICYRIAYNDIFDVILVLSNNKTIITLYLNNNNDSHVTLKENLYQSA